jgi:hypothetical protein
MRLALALAPLLTCCTLAPGPASGWRFEGLDARGEVRVVPVLALHDDPTVEARDYVTAGITDRRHALRAARVEALSRVPETVATALPGAVHARLDPAWHGRFRVGHLPLGARDRLAAHLRRDDVRALDELLVDLAARVGGDATLFTWIRDLDGTPLTLETFPGDRVQTPAGPVLLDLYEEPYRVTARLGMALVTADGHVVARYEDAFSSLLTPHRAARQVALDLANGLAAEVAPMWPDDPGLWRHDTAYAEADPVLQGPGTPPRATPRVPFRRGPAAIGLRDVAHPPR